MIYDIIIIGAGPSGITTAIYAKNARMNVLIVELSSIGGKLNEIAEITNYPGYKKITGEELAKKMSEQLEDVDIVYDKIVNIIKGVDGTKIAVGTLAQYSAKNIVIATGTTPKKLDVNIDEKYLSTCELCDGSLCLNQHVVVVGGGNSAFACALYLEKIAKRVTVVIRSNKARAFEYLILKAEQSNKIKLLYNSRITRVAGSRIYLNNGIFCEPFKIFIKIGEIPVEINTQLNEKDGVFKVGSCSCLVPNQIITAESDAVSKFVKEILVTN